MPTLNDLYQQLQAAILANDYAAIAGLLSRIQELELVDPEQGFGDDKGRIPDGFNTLNPPLNPRQPHGDQSQQRSYWDLTGSRCGRCTVVPRYWRLTFDWTRPSGPDTTFDQLFGDSFAASSSAPHWDFRNWFVDITRPESGPVVILRRGRMARPAPEGVDSFREAVAARSSVEYDRCFWKCRVRLQSDRPPYYVAGNGLNVAWFLYYSPAVATETVRSTDSQVNSSGETGWTLAVIENQKRKPTAGGTVWTNSFAPLLRYELIHPGDPNPYEDRPPTNLEQPARPTFQCMGRNEFRLVQTFSPIPLHVAIVEPFFP